jgi:hypothetical protein
MAAWHGLKLERETSNVEGKAKTQKPDSGPAIFLVLTLLS